MRALVWGTRGRGFEFLHPDVNITWKLLDSFQHYRDRVGLGRLKALYRAFYFEIRHKEPWHKKS